VEVSSFPISGSISYEKRFQSWRYEKEKAKAMKRVHLADKGVDPVWSSETLTTTLSMLKALR
jgi:hypothetical protein